MVGEAVFYKFKLLYMRNTQPALLSQHLTPHCEPLNSKLAM